MSYLGGSDKDANMFLYSGLCHHDGLLQSQPDCGQSKKQGLTMGLYCSLKINICSEAANSRLFPY